MSQDWVPSGPAPEGQGQGLPVWQSPGAQAASVSAHWGLAIISFVLCWPLAIAACVFAAQVKPALNSGDVAGARRASKRVLVLFWVSLAIIVLVIIVSVAAGAGQSSSTG
jgi:hypothetical protein